VALVAAGEHLVDWRGEAVMNAHWAIAVAAIFIWLGMVLAISFLEAPLKFRAPGITIPLGLGIGRLVFRALNISEAVLGSAVVIALLGHVPPVTVLIAFGCAVLALAVQVLAVRPALTRRTDAVLSAAGTAQVPGRRSSAHIVYVALELVKVVSLLVAGILLLTG
jgi:hypothetical protein